MKISALPILLLLLNCGAAARACSCAPPPAPKIALQSSDAVFVGQAVSVEKTAKYQKSFVFKINKAWKGKAAGNVAIATASDGAMCGVNFDIGEQYLVYASRSDKVLRASLCSRTRHLNSAAADIAELNDPRPTAAQPTPEQILHSRATVSQRARPLQDLNQALRTNSAPRFRLFWPIGWQTSQVPLSGEKGSVTALYDRENETFKFYASYLRFEGAVEKRHIKHVLYTGVTEPMLLQLEEKYKDNHEAWTNFSFFDHLNEFGAISTDLGNKSENRQQD